MDLGDDQIERYARHLVLKEVGGVGQQRLLASRVLVVGAGGLGSPLLLYLAAAGVGTLGIVDHDMVSLSNLQRQVVHTTGRVGTPKTASATAMLAAINPDVRVIEHPFRLDAGNALELIGGYDLIADGSDNFATRFLLNDACYFARKPLVSAAIQRFDGQMATFRAYQAGEGFPCYRCLFGSPPPEAFDQSCSRDGVLGALAGVMGSLQAVEVIKELLGIGESQAGRLLLYDALEASFRTITVRRDPGCALCGAAPAITSLRSPAERAPLPAHETEA
jgi:molybdopterin-synthase adenylyltransferase